MGQQQGDVLLFQTKDDGEINITDGLIEMSSGLETAAYLSLFGGNEDDDGSDENTHNWWGNLSETEPEAQYRSQTQHLLQSLPATTGNLLRIQDAAEKDLAWLSSSVSVVVTMPGLNKVKLTIQIDQVQLEFEENWRASR
jgi:hypothetical protein